MVPSDINSGAFTVEATEASSVTTSGGDLTITADANNSKVVIKGDHESGTAIHPDGNAAAASVSDIDGSGGQILLMEQSLLMQEQE